jgi:hypothetical protein
MAKAAKKLELGAAWFTLQQMGAAFDVTAQGFHKQIRPLVPAEDVKQTGRRGDVRIRCRAAIDAFAAKAAAKVQPQDDALLAAGDSPELERYRAARASLAELELGERNASLVHRDQLEPAFTAYASAVRRAGEALQRRFGPEAVDLLNEALTEAEQAVRRTWGGAA